MKITLQQLASHLKKNLLPFYLIHGNEPLFVQEAKDVIRQCAKENGFTEHQYYDATKEFDWNTLFTLAYTSSLFSNKEIIILQLTQKPNAAASKILTTYLSQPDQRKIMIFISDKLDSATQKTSWFQALDKAGGIITIWPLDTSGFQQWVRERLQRYQIFCDKEAIQYLIHQTEGNVLAAAQEIEKLRLLFPNGRISAEEMMNAIADHARYDIFNFVDIVLQGDASQLIRVHRKLRQQAIEPTLLLWALTREIRQLIAILMDLNAKLSWDSIAKKHYIFTKRQPLLQKAVKKYSIKKLQQLLLLAEKIDQTIKGLQRGNVWDDLETLALGLSEGKLSVPSIESI